MVEPVNDASECAAVIVNGVHHVGVTNVRLSIGPCPKDSVP